MLFTPVVVQVGDASKCGSVFFYQLIWGSHVFFVILKPESYYFAGNKSNSLKHNTL